VIFTDLNDRERAKFAATFEKAATAFSDLAKSLRDGDDDKVLLHLILASFSGRAVTELAEIMEKASVASMPDFPPTPKQQGGVV
jgi:hypothetical protein